MIPNFAKLRAVRLHTNCMRMLPPAHTVSLSIRYKSAQLKLIDIMHVRGATPGKPILRPALREEARKDIGDTGLLDHLLKHMTDTVITNGERFRRRHNAEGAMEYWLEDASLMEIRKAAGIEDPSWIPPPGWQPGDAFPGRGEYGYGCFNRGMTPAEVAEMKKLKENVNKVRRYGKKIVKRNFVTIFCRPGQVCIGKFMCSKLKSRPKASYNFIFYI